MAEILHFEILRKHGQTNTHKQTHRHGHYNTSPSPYGGRGNNTETSQEQTSHNSSSLLVCISHVQLRDIYRIIITK